MFGKSNPFTDSIAHFDSKLDRLSWNDGNLIMELTGLARGFGISDAQIAVSCIIYRVITNPPKSRLPVIYVLDSIVKNVAQPFEELFAPNIATLFSSIFDISETDEERAPLLKLLAAWVSRSAFSADILKQIKDSVTASAARRLIKPVPSGWPPILPAGAEALPSAELQIIGALYSSIYPLATPSIDELTFTKDAIVALHWLLQQTKPQLGRPRDPEIDELLRQYQYIKQIREACSLQHQNTIAQSAIASNVPATSIPTHPVPTPVAPVPVVPTHHAVPLPQPSLIHQPIVHTPPTVLPTTHFPSYTNPTAPLLPSAATVATNYPHSNIPPTTNGYVGPIEPIYRDSKAAQSSNEPDADSPSLSDTASLKILNQRAIDQLYTNLPHQCSTCGLRFLTTDQMTAHLNWHYFERTALNTRTSGRNYSSSKLQRQWYLSAQDWIDTCGASAAQMKSEEKGSEKASSDSKATSNQTASQTNSKQGQDYPIVRIGNGDQEPQALCSGCGEDIEQPLYDDEGWYYPNTIKGVDGKLYHPNCLPEDQKDSVNISEGKKRSFDEVEVNPTDETSNEAKRPKLED